MNLNTERKVKFWLSTVSKVLIIALILFQLWPYLFGNNDKSVNKEIIKPASTEILIDSQKQEEKPNNPIKKVISYQGDQPINGEDISKSEKKDNPITKKIEKSSPQLIPNSVSIYIFNENKLDTQVGKQLENTYLNDYEIRAVQHSFNKEQLLAGNVISFGTTELVSVGTITYNFKEDNSKTTCELVLNFDTYSTNTGIKQKNLSKSLSTYGIGFSKEQAKQNAVKKIH